MKPNFSDEKIFFLFLSVVLTVTCNLFCSSDYLFCEENEPPQLSSNVQTGKPVVVNADNVEYLDDMQKILGTGNIRIDYKNAVLKADNVEVDIATKQAVATGNVSIDYNQVTITGKKLFYNFVSQKGVMNPGDEAEQGSDVIVTHKDVKVTTKRIDFDFAAKKAVAPFPAQFYQGETNITADNLVYDFSAEKGVFDTVRARSGLWYGRAEKAEKIDEQEFIFRRGSITTCDFDKPHYRIQGRKIDFYVDDKIVIKNALLFVGNVPVMYFPYWEHSLKQGKSNVAVSAGSKKEWGWFILTSWRYSLSEQVNAKVHLDHRELKGVAGGVDVDYDSKYGQGLLKTYHMNERDKYYDKHYTDEEDKKKKKVEETEKYRVQLKHRRQIDPSTLALLEYNKMSDMDFIKDYLYREYESDVRPASETSLAHYDPAYNVRLYARKRTNRFYTEVERLPEAGFDLMSKKIADTNLYYRETMAVANLNLKNANSDMDTDVNRFDTYQELKYPTRLPSIMDWINIAPFAGMRQTYYSKDLNGEEADIIRGIHYYGLELNTKFYRISDYTGAFSGVEINHLRHVVTPSVVYNYVHNPTIPSYKLGAFDEIDTIFKSNIFTFGLENHLQTKWKKDDSDEMDNADLIYFYPHVDYINRVEPGVRNFSNITSELDIMPWRWLYITSDTVYNQYQRRFQTANIDFSAFCAEDWSVTLGKRYERDISEQFTADLYYKINRFWQVRTYGRYLSYADTWQEQQYTLYRDLHCWLLELTYDIKMDTDGTIQDRIFWFIFRLKAFPDETPIPINIGRDTFKRF